MAKALALLSLALLATGALAKHHHHHDGHLSQKFRECLCWNSTTNEFCLGNDWYDQDVCKNLAIGVAGWAPAAFVFSLCFILFPLIFYISRWCCRCCGGRYSTRGCCCSDVSSRASFPGYRNCSITATKIFFFVTFACTIPLAVNTFVSNSHLHTDVLALVDSVKSDVDGVQGQLSQGTEAAVALSVGADLSAAGLAPASLVEAMKGMSDGMNQYMDSFNHVFSNVRKAETNGFFGRNVISYYVPASGLLVLLTTAILALVNTRQLVGLMMIAMCMHLATMLFIQAPQAVAHNGAHLVCHNYDETVVPLVQGQATVSGICGRKDTTDAIAELASRFNNYVTSSDSDFCRDFKTACDASSSCGDTPCADFATYSRSVSQNALPTDPAEAVSLVSQLLVPVLSAEGSQAVADAVARLRRFNDVTVGHLRTMFGPVAQFNTECATIVSMLHSDAYDNLCHHSTSKRLGEVSGLMAGAVGVGVFTVISMIFGMKRFRARNTYNPDRDLSVVPILSDDAQPQSNVVVAAVYPTTGALNDDAVSGVVVTKEVAYVPRATYGTADDEYRRV